jgi:hypothetical protein
VVPELLLRETADLLFMHVTNALAIRFAVALARQ